MRKFYIASKTVHGPRWRRLRDAGHEIISTWIDEAEVGATSDWADLWVRCVCEAASADALLLYREPGEFLKGALVEAGAALASGKIVYAVGCEGQSFTNHPLVVKCSSLDDALQILRRQ